MEGRSLREAYSETKDRYQQKQVSRWWLVLWAVLFLVCIEVGAQMFYPDNQALFNTYVDGLDVSNKSRTEVSELLIKTYENQKVIIESLDGGQIEFSLTELGASIDVSKQVSVATS